MRSARLYGPEDLRIEPVDMMSPGPGEVLIKIEAALSCGTDLKMWRRGYHPALPPLPCAFGHEAAGTIATVGEGVTQFQKGQRVVAANSAPCHTCFYCQRKQYSLCESLTYFFGAFGEYAIIPAPIVAENLYEIPPSLSFSHAALLEPLACAVHGVAEAGLHGGETVAIVGGGAIGLMLARVAILQGAHVILAGHHPQRLQIAEALDVTRIVNSSAVEDPISEVKSFTEDGRGADVVIEAVGRPEAWEEAIPMSRKGGLAIMFGGCARGTSINLETYTLHYGARTLKGVYHHHPEYARQALELLARGDVDGRLLVSGSVPLDRVTDAFEMMTERKGLKYAVIPNG